MTEEIRGPGPKIVQIAGREVEPEKDQLDHIIDLIEKTIQTLVADGAPDPGPMVILFEDVEGNIHLQATPDLGLSDQLALFACAQRLTVDAILGLSDD